MKNNTDITKFQLTALLDDWRAFHKAIGDLNRQRFVDVSVDEVVVWNQTADHTVIAILSATHADYIQIVQRVLGSQANNELESISFSVESGLGFSDVDEADADLTMELTSLGPVRKAYVDPNLVDELKQKRFELAEREYQNMEETELIDLLIRSVYNEMSDEAVLKMHDEIIEASDSGGGHHNEDKAIYGGWN